MATSVETGPFAHLGAALVDLQLPSPEAEEWRYSRVADLDPTRCAAATATPPDAAVADAEAMVADFVDGLDEPPSAVVVLVDGVVVRVTVVDDRVQVDTSPSVPDDEAPDVFSIVNEHVATAEVVVGTQPGARPTSPVVVASCTAADDVVVAPRLRIRLGADSELAVVELHRSLGASTALVLPVTRVDVGRDATLRHVVVQDVDTGSDVVGSIAAEVAGSATYDGWLAAIGGRYARTRVDCRLAGRGADGRLASLYAGGGDQMRDLRTFQDHLDRDTTSTLEFKGAVDDRAHAVYTGLIRIHPEAKGSNAEQSNRIMTLSDEAWAESVPNLEIEHNDVRCAHASTVGPVDADQRFYLESRGVPTDVAERLIVAGFFDEILERCCVPAVAGLVRPRVARVLGGGGS